MKDFPWNVGASFFCCLFSQVDFCARCHTMLQQLFEGRSETLGPRSPEAVRQHFFEGLYIWGFPKMVGSPNKPMGFPTKNEHFGV